MILLALPLLPAILTFLLLDKMRVPILLNFALSALVEFAVVDLTCLVFLDVSTFWYVTSGVVSAVSAALEQIYIHAHYLLYGEMPSP